MGDLPDYTKYITQQIEIPAVEQGPVIPRPKGGIKETGSITTSATYAAVASRTVTKGKTFQLSKVVLSAEKASWFKYRWGGVDISSERLMDDKTIVIEHFPWDYHSMLGDGSKKFEVRARQDTEVGTFTAEIVGEEI